MSGFSDPILTGDGSLIRDSAHSPDYVPGMAGWSINQDGSAEFNAVALRGSMEARRGNAAIRMDPAGPFLSVNPNDTLYANGGITTTDFDGNRAELVLTAPEATTGVGPSISLTSGLTGTAQVGDIRLNADTVNLAVPWRDFPLTWGASVSAPSFGTDATVVARELNLGAVVFVSIDVTFGATATFGSGVWSFAGMSRLPKGGRLQTASVVLIDATGGATSPARYAAAAMLSSGGVFRIPYGSSSLGVSSNVPFTWTAGDQILISGSYEPA